MCMSRVVVVRYREESPTLRLNRDEYRRLLETGLRALTDEAATGTAVCKLIPPGVVGMKPNCLARKLNSTPVALTEAMCELLTESGFAANDLVIWERSNRELSDGGYSLNASSSGVRCLATDTNGIGYSRGFYSFGEVNSLVTRVLADQVEHNINLPVLKDHSLAGLSGGMKNMYGAIHNPNKYHDCNCDPYCAHIFNLEPIRTKNRLTIIDAVRVQYHGGPGYMSQFLAWYGGLVISADPVAADRIGLEILENIRTAHGQPPLAKAGRPVKYLATAEKIGLGVADLNRIDSRVVVVDKTGRETSGGLL